MKSVAIRVEHLAQNDVETIRVVFENLMWRQGVELFHERVFVEEYLQFILSFAQGRRALVQLGSFGHVEPSVMLWLARENIAYAESVYTFSGFGDWSYENKDGSFEIVFEPSESDLRDLLRVHAVRGDIALLVLKPNSVVTLQEVSRILATPDGVGRVAHELLDICEWLILTQDDGETVIFKSRRGDAVAEAEAHLTAIRRAVN